MVNKKTLYKISYALVIFGAISYGLYGLTGYDLIDYVFADNLMVIAEILDVLIGLAGVYLLFLYFSEDKKK